MLLGGRVSAHLACRKQRALWAKRLRTSQRQNSSHLPSVVRCPAWRNSGRRGARTCAGRTKVGRKLPDKFLDLLTAMITERRQTAHLERSLDLLYGGIGWGQEQAGNTKFHLMTHSMRVAIVSLQSAGI